MDDELNRIPTVPEWASMLAGARADITAGRTHWLDEVLGDIEADLAELDAGNIALSAAAGNRSKR